MDPASLFFIMEYAPNGDLSGLIKKEKKLSNELTRFYAAELINALEHLREFKVVHRDLKPENVLLDGNCHIKLTDFGDSKIIDIEEVHKQILSQSFLPDRPKIDNFSVDPDFENNFQFEEKDNFGENRDKREGSFVGTPLYVSPEMLNHNLATYATDLWALG
jgi:serine/threonine protein kinase